MSPRPASPLFARRLRLAGAALLATLVFVLGLLGSSPVLHAALHHDDHGHAALPADDSGCVVLLYAHGVTAPPPPVVAPTPPPLARAVHEFPRDQIARPDPGHLRPPGRGPPVVG